MKTPFEVYNTAQEALNAIKPKRPVCPKTLVEYLTEVRGYVAKGWFAGSGEFGRDAAGGLAFVDTPACVQYTLAGAISKATPTWTEIYAIRAMYIALRKIHGHRNVVDWENVPGRTQAEVLALIDAAIASETTEPVGIDYGP